MKFSQRIGITPAIKVAQKESMDKDLRNGLWSVLCLYYWRENADSSSLSGLLGVPSDLDDLINRLWFEYFKYPIDKIGSGWMYDLRMYYFNATWYQVYDFIEFIANYGPPEIKDSFITANCNQTCMCAKC